MFLEKVFNLRYLGFNHDSNSYGLRCGQGRMSVIRTCASRLIEEEKKVRFRETYFYPPFYDRIRKQIRQE